jgi:glyoxylase-like metal-dependent hydrolase (beta-lactamase superfamily II)
MASEVCPGVWCVDVEYVRPGLASSHIVVDHGRAAIVDTGTTLAAGRVMSELAALGLAPKDVDAVLLKHIHRDHAGGAGAQMQRLPRAACHVHPRGVRHLADPAQLVAGARAVYGDEAFAALYGEIVPIDAKRLVAMEDGQTVRIGERVFEYVHTPGHALHHAAIADAAAALVFSGDTFGISYREFDTARGPFVFPTTTPVQFDPGALHASIDRLMARNPASMILTHYSRVDDLGRLARDMHESIDGFVEIAERHAAAPDRTARIAEELFAYLSERLEQHGYTGDTATRHALLGGDVMLNTQGLDVWLTKKQPRQ